MFVSPMEEVKRFAIERHPFKGGGKQSRIEVPDALVNALRAGRFASQFKRKKAHLVLHGS
jgi:hypothetical protein